MENNRAITYQDLLDVKEELLREIKAGNAKTKAIEWMKSKDVRKLLDISPGKLQDMRNKDEIPFTRIGGVIYYQKEAIHEMMASKSNLNVR